MPVLDALLDVRLVESFNPSQPRGWHGRWTHIGQLLHRAADAAKIDGPAHATMQRAVKLHASDRSLSPSTLRGIQGHLSSAMKRLSEAHDRSDRSGHAVSARAHVHAAHKVVAQTARSGHTPSASHTIARLFRGSAIYAQ